ncbi:aspartyl/asparaginyl beta-hydroxylase domain-containing protein [Streptomyces sp. NPDC050619]|uniref:aspartyl/asparaginyl beta-hydroxylase domain-containing protein n=1 Tax=Streptomyces sp. NPDC050619 TaxID=3157214 RepID=UPI003427C42A
MQTQILGHVELDATTLAHELKMSESLTYAEPYDEFQCGRRPWRSRMLYAPGGEVGDGVLSHYDSSLPVRPTVHGEQLPHLKDVIEANFPKKHLLFARLVSMTESVLVPHRDLHVVAHRLHVPLRTSEQCLFLQENTVFRMLPGEVWSLDLTQMHSAAVMDRTDRVHLLLDFPGDAPVEDFIASPGGAEASLADRTVPRPEMSESERRAALDLARLIDSDNITDVFAILIRKQFRRDGGAEFAWEALSAVAEKSRNPEVESYVRRLKAQCTLEDNG